MPYSITPAERRRRAESTARAREALMANAARRAAGDPKKLSWATRVVRAGMAAGRITLGDIVGLEADR